MENINLKDLLSTGKTDILFNSAKPFARLMMYYNCAMLEIKEFQIFKLTRQIAIFSGYAKEMQSLSWKVADNRTYVPFAEKKYDIMIFGMPQFYHYGDGMGTNPIMLMQGLSAQVIRHKRVMSNRCVIRPP